MSTPSDAEVKEKQMQAKAIAQIANVSRLLRDAISASIPVAPEQYLTIGIPGETIDVRDIKDGGTYCYGKEYSAFVPPAVRQAEARLVDKMVPLAHIMVGNTGKSVSRSYSRALDGLVPRKATITSGVNQIRSPGVKSYDDAMVYLTKVDDTTGQTPVDIYVEKQAAWADAQDAWDKAKIKAQQTAKANNPSDIVAQRQEYDDWNQSNYRKFKFAVQGRWMDWVANGHKYDVEYNFGMVDTESIMARVEQSKESMRNSTIVDSDGANELQGVILDPKNWAILCQQKQEDWFKKNGAFSIDQINAEIDRLQRLQTSYEVLESVTSGAATAPSFPIASPEAPATTPADAESALKAKYLALYNAEAAVSKENVKIKKLATADDRDKERKSDAYTNLVKAVDKARTELDTQIQTDKAFHSDLTKYQVASLTAAGSKQSLGKWLDTTIATIKSQVKALTDKRDQTFGGAFAAQSAPAIVGGHTDDNNNGTDVAAPGSELSDPLFGVQPPPDQPTSGGPAAADPTLPQAGTESDPWTTISASFSAQDQSSTATSSSWGTSVGGGAGWGLWSVGGSYSHEQSQNDSVSDMASCDVSVSFDALVVNITRPWLYAELFNDFELDVADHILLSPGAEDLHKMMLAQKAVGDDPLASDTSVISKLAQYNSFPAFPTSFLLAANTSIEFHGDTQHIEDHFSAQSNSGSVSVGWGPFSVSSSFHQSSTKQTHQMQSTATGCRLTFGAPQIIGWVSQILPALPRKDNYEPMVQNVVSG